MTLGTWLGHVYLSFPRTIMRNGHTGRTLWGVLCIREGAGESLSTGRGGCPEVGCEADSLLLLTPSSDPRTAGGPGHRGGLSKLCFPSPPSGTRDPGGGCPCQPRDGQFAPRTQQVSSSPRGTGPGGRGTGLISVISLPSQSGPPPICSPILLSGHARPVLSTALLATVEDVGGAG